jgi:Raf kinase inhibitor-like YbhB/YbcL family protein
MSDNAHSFRLWSPDLANGVFSERHTANGFGQQGLNISPQLCWTGAPEGTRSFVLTVFDPDAPTGSGFWHWVLANLPGGFVELSPSAGNDKSLLPAGTVVCNTDFMHTGVAGQGGYGGPCPPSGHGTHHYQFSLYALDVPDLFAAAGIPPDGTATLVGFAVNFGLGAHVLGKASFVATFSC